MIFMNDTKKSIYLKTSDIFKSFENVCDFDSMNTLIFVKGGYCICLPMNKEILCASDFFNMQVPPKDVVGVFISAGIQYIDDETFEDCYDIMYVQKSGKSKLEFNLKNIFK